MRLPVPDADRRGALHRVLPVGGLVLFSPLALVLFDRPGTVLGIPVLLAFVFGAWLFGIALTLWLAQAEARRSDRPNTRPGEDEGLGRRGGAGAP